MRGIETRTERVYHEVNRNPGILTPGGRQWYYKEEWLEEPIEYEAF